MIQLDTPCIEWSGKLMPNGYGYFYKKGVPGTLYAHREAYKEHYGEIPPGMLVCHKCDNRKCVNHEHLFLGTHADNTHDMLAKGRHVANNPTGSRHQRSVLTPEQVRAIRLDGRSKSSIATAYGVSRSVIGAVKNGTGYKDVV